MNLDVDLVVNATPIGMQTAETPWPDGISLPADAAVYDLVYAPHPTRFVGEAKAAGHLGASGIGMLVEQGALSLELWTGLQVSRNVLQTAIELDLEALDV